MTFPHDDPEFDALLRIVAEERSLSVGLVEKDYWVTHSLWALHVAGLDVWFKGGTSLSKGFGLIQRFSEDLDLKIERGRVDALPAVTDWHRESKKAIAERQAFFQQMAIGVAIPGTELSLEDDPTTKWRQANVRVNYPGKHLAELDAMLPFVKLEIGGARVTPFVETALSSFVHDKLVELQQLGDFDDNRPRAVRCVHPLVTVVEKLDALQRRFPRDAVAPATFVRHFEDVARVVQAALPPMDGYDSVVALADEMLAQRQISALPSATDSCFSPSEGPRWDGIRDAYEAIAPMFWGARIPLDEACEKIREWTGATFASVP